MRIFIESTPDIVEVDGRRARIWVGHTDTDIPVLCYIWTISPQTHDAAVNAQFAKELIEITQPHVIKPIEVAP